MNRKNINWGLIAAGFANISGVLLFSKAFTNDVINQADPVVMSNFGLIMIIVWGFAYLATAATQSNIKWLLAVFAIEKLIYIISWLFWLQHNSLQALYSEDLFAGAFFSIYGVNDILFMVFFVWAFISHSKDTHKIN